MYHQIFKSQDVITASVFMTDIITDLSLCLGMITLFYSPQTVDGYG